ncbi:MAG: glycosyltransferase [Deltaproteobacteria bacterium]|nr:glycosyltransferase [Deltaproteobacteria bacterium]
MPSTLSIGLITYNRTPAISRCLESLTKQASIPDQVVIVDSSDNDETRMVAGRFRQELNILYLKQKERTIMPVARNICVNNATSQYIAFIDDDAVAKQKWTETIVSAFLDNKNLGGITGPTINTTPDLKPLEKIITDAKNRNYILPWGEVRSDARRWVPLQPVFCTAMQGGNMSYPVALLREVGGFDEQYFNPSFREESDLQMRIIRKGFKFLYHPDVFVWHVPGVAGGIQDIEQDPPFYFYLAGKNHRYFCDKYFSKWLTRPAWLLWNGNPPCLWLAFLLTILRRKNYFAWHKGLWGFQLKIRSKIRMHL